MNVVVLRVFAPAFDVKDFLTRFPRLEVDAVWAPSSDDEDAP